MPAGAFTAPRLLAATDRRCGPTRSERNSLPQLALHRAKIGVMADARAAAARSARAAGRDRSPTDGNRRSPAVRPAVHLPDRPARKAIGQQPEEAAAARRQRAGRQARTVVTGSSIRSAPCDRAEGEARRFGPAIMVVHDRRDAGRIGIALLGQDRVRPRRARIDREARRAIAGHARPRRILDRRARPREIGAERSGVSVNTRLWSQPWLAISCPASTIRRISAGCRSATQPSVKKVAFTPASVEQVEHGIAVALDTRRQRRPSRPGRSPVSNAPTWNQSSTSTESALRMRRLTPRP